MSSIYNTETHGLPSRPRDEGNGAMLATAGYSGQTYNDSGLFINAFLDCLTFLSQVRPAVDSTVYLGHKGEAYGFCFLIFPTEIYSCGRADLVGVVTVWWREHSFDPSTKT